MTVGPWEELLWVVMGVGLVVYALTGGADLGAGVWDLLARGPRRDAQRRAVEAAIAPIWEANHVWLIFVIVVMFSAFPKAFAAISIALHIPIGLALVGLTFRGAAFVFRAYGLESEAGRDRWGRVFAWSSLVTPVFLGVVIGALASGDIRLDAEGRVATGFVAGWTTPFAWLVGAFALVLFALLSAVYLTAETEGELRRDFRRRALACEVVAGVLAALVFWRAGVEAPELFEGLGRSGWSWPVQGATAAFALATCWLLWSDRPRAARVAVATQVGLVVLAWGLAMDHHFVLPDLPLRAAGADPRVLPYISMALACGSVLLLPALWYLYRVFKRTPE